MTRLAPLALAAYILIRGCDASVLKWLQERGVATALRTGGGEDPISLCNVFFFATLLSGLVLAVADRRRLERELPKLGPGDLGLLGARAGLGFLVGPSAYFLALQHLSVVSQTLLFTLILPVTALLAHAWLAEPLPPRFGLTLLLLPGGLAISRSMAGAAQPGADLDPRGLVWALVAVAAFAGAGVLNRLVARRSWGLGLTLGLTNLAAALVFGSLALALFGPNHFLHMRLWWLVGVLVVYSGVINLGGDLALLASYRGLGAIAVALWGNAAVLVALASAHWLLGEAIGARTLVGAALILVALLVSRRWGSSAG